MVVVILGSSLVGFFLSGRKKDSCLKHFQDYLTTAQFKDGKKIWGEMDVETSGVEFRYKGNYWDDGHVETSFIIFKEEFNSIFAFFRFHHQLSPENQQRRLDELKRAYRPTASRRFLRHMRNMLGTLKDSVGASIGAATAVVKSTKPALRAVSSQQAHVVRAQSDVLSYVGASYDPILEKHIGHMVVIEITNPQGAIEEHVGIFKDYSAQFLEIMEVPWKMEDGSIAKCDMLVPRAHSVIRHSAEEVSRPGLVAEKELETVQAQGQAADSFKKVG
jgi:hypothetical protein